MPDNERSVKLPPPDPGEMADRLQRRAQRILDLERENQQLREALRQIMYAPIDTTAADMAEIAADAFNAR